MGKSDIDWTEHTWNVVSGCAMPIDCAVRGNCYANIMAQRLAGRFGYPADNPMAPTFHEDKLDEPSKRKKPTIYFVCSMGDLFGKDVPSDWIERVLKVTREHPEHLYLFLTKNPERYKEFEGKFGHTCGLGTTVNRNIDLRRLNPLLAIKTAMFRFISFEPLYESMESLESYADYSSDNKLFDLPNIDLFIIGAQTRPNFQPQEKWVQKIVEIADKYGISVFMKNNLRMWGLRADATRRQEFPFCFCKRIGDWIPVRKCNKLYCYKVTCNRAIEKNTEEQHG